MRGLGCDNCNGNTRRLAATPRFSAAPSWYDNLYNEVSSGAENLWNDVESAGVWLDNTLLGPFSAQSAATAGMNDALSNGPLTQADNAAGNFNPIQSGYNAGQATRQTIGSDLTAAGNAIKGALTGPVLLIGGIILAAIILEKD
jgi:hypothetical protein